MAQLQAKGDATVTALANSLNVSTSGSILTVSISLPQQMLQDMVKQQSAAQHHRAEHQKK
jgi:hypothetical protein